MSNGKRSCTNSSRDDLNNRQTVYCQIGKVSPINTATVSFTTPSDARDFTDDNIRQLLETMLEIKKAPENERLFWRYKELSRSSGRLLVSVQRLAHARLDGEAIFRSVRSLLNKQGWRVEKPPTGN